MGEKIFLGFGDNIDYEIRWNSKSIERMIKDYDLSPREIDPDIEVDSPRALLASLLGFAQWGRGGERFVRSPALIEDFAGNFEKKITLGGTAVRAAIAMRKLGYISAVHLVTMNEHVERLLPPDCSRLCSNAEASFYPHLIVQFQAGTEINANGIHININRPDRVIYTNDKDNALMKLHPDLPLLFEDVKVFLISGFNTMQDAVLLENRLNGLLRAMERLPPGTVVFYEDAGFHKKGISDIVRRYLLKHINIYSLNEDELQGYLGQSLALTDPAAVASALRDIAGIIPCPLLVLHTRNWALAYGDSAPDYTRALLGGIIMATTRFRFGDNFTAGDYAATGALPPEEQGVTFASEIHALLGDRVFCVPSFQVLEKNVTTIGLGDTFVGGFLPALL
ncbi:MAG: ADP-dependent glucokinase/phosphofructokinase [Spirochaetaceae bacterium]|jgi:ADP-dependent phosphofructokinase/glucokinase|nr:ADP-dependent glucokinase/phosphofructokinase [Spirochaetaceae bacterium]